MCATCERELAADSESFACPDCNQPFSGRYTLADANTAAHRLSHVTADAIADATGDTDPAA